MAENAKFPIVRIKGQQFLHPDNQGVDFIFASSVLPNIMYAYRDHKTDIGQFAFLIGSEVETFTLHGETATAFFGFIEKSIQDILDIHINYSKEQIAEFKRDFKKAQKEGK
jgi:hypothetical protein